MVGHEALDLLALDFRFSCHAQVLQARGLFIKVRSFSVVLLLLVGLHASRVGLVHVPSAQVLRKFRASEDSSECRGLGGMRPRTRRCACATLRGKWTLPVPSARVYLAS